MGDFATRQRRHPLRLWPFARGLRARLFVLVGLALLPAIGLLLFIGVDQQQTEVREFHAQTLSHARLAAQAHQRRIEAVRQLLVSLSNNPLVREGDDAACTQVSRALIRDYTGLYAIGRANSAGIINCHALDHLPGLSIADRDYFQDAVMSGEFVVGTFMQGRIRRQPMLGFGYPLRDGTGAIRQVVFATMDLATLSQTLEVENGIPGSTMSLLDSHGVMIARSDDAQRFMGTQASAREVATMKERGEMVTVFTGPDHVRRVFAIVAIKDASNRPIAFATVGVPESHLASLVDSHSRVSLVAIALLGVGLMTAAWFGSELLIRRPINKLMGATAALASGRLEVRTPPVGGAHELEVLASALNQMAEKLEQRDLHLREGQRLEAIGQLAGGIAHDFNNLLTVIIGYAEVLKESLAIGTPEANQLAELRKASERAASLTQQLLAFSRRQVLVPTTLQLNDVISDMTSLLRHTTGGAVAIELSLDEQLGTIEADRGQMEQVMLNLIINARDAMPSGGAVTIATRNLEMPPDVAATMAFAGGAMIQLSVSDTGIGMDAATRQRVFEPFFSTKGSRGNGLGLATVYGIVKQSGGHITCESEPGRGTRFSIVLPRKAATIPERAAAPLEAIGGSETILLVDDDDAVRTVVETMLAKSGYRVRATADPREALAWISAASPFDLLLTDVSMPGMNGVTLAQATRQLRPDVPAILMSGHGSPSIGTDDRRPTAFLQKPLTKPGLLKAIRMSLDGAGA